MNKLVKILIVLNLIVVVCIIFKFVKQNKNINYVITDSNITLEELKDVVKYEILSGRKCYSEEVDGKRINTSEEMKKNLVVEDGLVLENFDIEYDGFTTSLSATLKNTSTEEKGGYEAELMIYQNKESEGFPLKAYINVVPANSEIQFVTGVNANIVDIYRCEIVKIEEEVIDE